MNQEQILQEVLPFVGGASNISRHFWQKNVLHLAVKDVGVLQLEALRELDIAAGVELNRGRVSITIQGSEKEEEMKVAKKNYDELINNIGDLVGGAGNVSAFIHCMTRLRFTVKDKNLVDTEKVAKLPGVAGTQWVDMQLQVIVGQGVDEVYTKIANKMGLQQAAAIDENLDKKVKFSPKAASEAFIGCIIPLLPLMIGCSLIRLIATVCSLTGILSTDSNTYITLIMASEAGMYFFPIAVAFSAAKKFNADVAVAMALCAILVSPTFVANVTEGVSMSIFGLPIYSANYTNMLFPSIFTVWIMSYVERFVKKYCPEIFKVMLVPLVTLLVMIPVMLCVTAPAGIMLGNVLSTVMQWIYGTLGPVGVALLTACFPILILFGMHAALTPAVVSYFMQYYCDPLIMPSNYLATMCLGAASLAVLFKSKNVDTKGTAATVSATALIAGVSEPALFSVCARFKTPLIASVIGGLVAGAYAGLMHVAMYAGGGMGIFSAVCFISEYAPMNVVHYIIAMAIGAVVSFIASFIMYKDPKKA